MQVPEIDLKIGIEVYATRTKGIDGKIRQKPEDFIVEEILRNGLVATVNLAEEMKTQVRGGGPHLVCILIKRGWDTLLVTKEIAFRLGIHPRAINIAGMKDAKAVTAQYISILGVKPESIKEVKIENAKIIPLKFSRNPLSHKDLWGNKFKIVVRDVEKDKEKIWSNVNKIMRELEELGGNPNFYAYQRFGTLRPITHEVGRNIVKRRYKDAIMVFLSECSNAEREEIRNARKILKETEDYRKALKVFPKHLVYERVMLKHLAKKPKDYIGALRRLPKKLLKLFVNAYQSYLFNKTLSLRMKRGISLKKPQEGDYIVKLDKSGLPDWKQVIRVDNQKTKKLVDTGEARLVLPIVGYKQKVLGEIQREVLEVEEVKPEDFKIGKLPEASSPGGFRVATMIPYSFKVEEIGDDELNEKRMKVTLSFKLVKGSYATTLLREIMKPKNPLESGF